jgi:hypothetical protein
LRNAGTVCADASAVAALRRAPALRPAPRRVDFEIVRYRYRWTSGGRLVTSAALSDALRNNAARPGETLACEVTPSDGRLRGPSASARATLPG